LGILAGGITLAIIDKTCKNRRKEITPSQHEGI
jgi:hypothetical protein